MVTDAQLKSLFPRAKEAHLESFSTQHEAVFKRYGISENPSRLHFFLAQIGHESGGLSIVEENLNYSARRLMEVFPNRFKTVADAENCAGNSERFGCQVYGGRLGNGKPPSLDGYQFRGRGYIQLTGRSNYNKIGALAGIEDLAQHPERAASSEDALILAAAFWKSRNINDDADADDFVTATRKINGGTVGITERRAWLAKVRRTLSEPPTKQLDAETVLSVQKSLIKKGFKETGAPDGLLGRSTAAAINLFRERNGLPSGSIDRSLLEALGLN